ncbi:unnamed protein product [Lactuca saligna]|uniref:Uncharacterized protein n=1 Tax=Lactuca saligna TaxID=75948 RepID=A0AA35YDQ4_LACSI|nr:unnamed protein product [Lactuca saligna]
MKSFTKLRNGFSVLVTGAARLVGTHVSVALKRRGNGVLCPEQHRCSVMRETNGGGERSAAAAPTDSGVTNHENALRQSRGSEVLVVPIRILMLPSEASRSSMGVLLPVVTEEGAF